MTPKYKRVLLKLSGEALAGKDSFGININELSKIAKLIKEAYDCGVDLAIVVGGGNIFRGMSLISKGLDRTTSDYMGMLGTLINALALQDAIEKLGIQTRVLSAISVTRIAEQYIRRRAIRHLEKKRIVIFACGTGNPYFSTDTAAALRASEIEANIVLKATQVDGVYDKDPKKSKNAKRFDQITYLDILNKNLKIMDLTAISLCMEVKMPIFVFNLHKKNSIKNAILGIQKGTLITNLDTKQEK